MTPEERALAVFGDGFDFDAFAPWEIRQMVASAIRAAENDMAERARELRHRAQDAEAEVMALRARVIELEQAYVYGDDREHPDAQSPATGAQP